MAHTPRTVPRLNVRLLANRNAPTVMMPPITMKIHGVASLLTVSMMRENAYTMTPKPRAPRMGNSSGCATRLRTLAL